ncbi:hypothetical protein W97_01126 [Coniosporium apollinis CBS 100218]|uniref:Partial AB-hydrolase lipase domain-containing protein n=1 Tax=Coniosporium apollinis (strain CBS 100218) TaxID=1168221 RepID=R7YJ48_CONA1|nr:uncharacterized protein W97_01126 [Coniosporium apollinis CBS 100218]EON61908.1 hypothetical protein W97_01126 [Coniosporium apollinis CBS 100218]
MLSLTASEVTTKSSRPSRSEAAIQYAHQAERLAQYIPAQENDTTGSTQAIEAKFITAQDPVIEIANGARLPAVPIKEAIKLNRLKDILEGRNPSQHSPVKIGTREAKDGTIHGARPNLGDNDGGTLDQETNGSLRSAVPPYRTNPLFPQLPLYGPPTPLKDLQVLALRISSAIGSICFLFTIVLGALFTMVPLQVWHRFWMRVRLKNPDSDRPFYHEEKRRRGARREEERAWVRKQKQRKKKSPLFEAGASDDVDSEEEFVPLEGGPDPLVCDVGYYARRVGLDCEMFSVQTEDGFIITLWHLYNPRTYTPSPPSAHGPHSPSIFPSDHTSNGSASSFHFSHGSRKYPVLLIPGLLQSAGAYCTNDDTSLAFYLAKSGLDVWLGNNRCGFSAQHAQLDPSDPRMWAWNIRQMGVMDLPALISRVLSETGFPKLALVAHSQGTTQTFVALAKEQRPDIGGKISVFCALAPAAYAGPLIGKMYLKFMRVISPGMFRAIFGVHAFIPFMLKMHALLPGKFYGRMGYLVFSFLFNWTDERWERDLRDRCFQFAPVYVSAESMRWWLGRECFARQKCILATREEGRMEDEEDEEEDQVIEQYYSNARMHRTEKREPPHRGERDSEKSDENEEDDRGRFAWYDEQCPPMAFWVAGADDLVDGRRLLRRFERGREPYVDLVHAKIIEGYEHLDVIWAMDAIEKVGKEVKEIIWRTAPEESRKICRTPKGCDDVKPFERRNGRIVLDGGRATPDRRHAVKTGVDATAGEWNEAEKKKRDSKEEQMK